MRARNLFFIGLLALILSCTLQRHNESRRAAENLSSADPANKEALEAGLLALGGFRGLLADVLWVRAIGQQDAGRYYELKLICDLIQRLQPTFIQVHVFQADNMAYNLAVRSESCEDKWYWVRSAIQTLEKGIERNERHYGLWFHLGYLYFDRLSDQKLFDRATGQDCRGLRKAELPRLADLDENLRKHPFSEPEKWQKGRAADDENWRLAAYYFFKSLQTKSEVNPLRTERVFGNCLDHLGHYRSKMEVPEEQRKWDEWGSEEWWKRLVALNKQRGMTGEVTAAQNLRFTVLLQAHLYDKRMLAAKAAHNPAEAAKAEAESRDTWRRFKEYFPEEKDPPAVLLTKFRDYMSGHDRYRGNLERE